MQHNKNAWRWNLDPRDPDYEEPPSQEELERAEESRLDAYIEQLESEQ